MKGISFVIDENGGKRAVQLDLEQHGDLWEDVHDQLIADQRADEPRQSLDEVRQSLTKAGKLGE
jgi:hypothetical protein